MQADRGADASSITVIAAAQEAPPRCWPRREVHSAVPVKPQGASKLEAIPLRDVLRALRGRESFRGLILFALFFGLFMRHASVLLDSENGVETVSWLEDAIRDQYDLVQDDMNGWCVDGSSSLTCYESFDQKSTLRSLQEFITRDLGLIVAGISSFCPDCLIAVTNEATDIRSLALSSFFCADFQPRGGGNGSSLLIDLQQGDRFVPRDCDAVDADFRAHPSLEQAPCCSNGQRPAQRRQSADLRRASLALIVRSVADPEASDTPEFDVLAGGGMVVEHSEAYVRAHLDHQGPPSTLAQIVVMTRELHAVGIIYSASWVDRRYLPRRVATQRRYWSFNFGAWPGYVWFAASFAFLSSVHEYFALQSMTEDQVRRAWRSKLSIFEGTIVVTTVFLFIFSEVLLAVAPSVGLSYYAVVVACTELLMFCRCFLEGRVIPPLQLIVGTIVRASDQLFWFTAVMVATVWVFAGVAKQLFGAFDDGYSSFGTAFFTQFSIIVQGTGLEGPAFAFQPTGAFLMHSACRPLAFTPDARPLVPLRTRTNRPVCGHTPSSPLPPARQRYRSCGERDPLSRGGAVLHRHSRAVAR